MDIHSSPCWRAASGRLLLIGVLAAVAGCTTASERNDNRGRQIVEAHCQSCHAIGATGDSRAPEAPPFRALSARGYRVANLEGALRAGISQGHPPMPDLQLSSEDVDSVLAYLEAVQED